MADTLAEIYRNTLVSSDFNSSGEATIVTTDSSTSHVIKGVQAVEGDADILVGAKLEVNAFPVVSLSGNSSGTEIVAPSSTVKVKATGFPLAYEDRVFALRTTGGTAYAALSEPFVNGIANKSDAVSSTANAFGFSMTGSDDQVVWQRELGPNNHMYLYHTNWNNQTNMYLYNSSGTQLYTHNDSYTPKWFDGERYSYWYDDSPAGVSRLDTWTNTVTVIASGSQGSRSTYARMFGIKDDVLIFWTEHTSYIRRLDLKTNVVSTVSGTTTASSVGLANADAQHMVKKSDGTLAIVQRPNNTRFRIWESYDFRGSGNTASGGYSDVTVDSGADITFDYKNHTPVIGSKLYFLHKTNPDDGNKYLGFLDLDVSDRSGQTALSLKIFDGATFPTPYPSNNYSLQTFTSEPSASTISGRTYDISPSLALRITGVTST
tara:strand:- start:259 stop:1557 length:1299 start_codon:yes stop_codon:yes gene_type:complete